MLTLSAKIRKEERPKVLRGRGFLPAVLYGPKIGNLSLLVEEKGFEKILKEAGESSLVNLEVGGKSASALPAGGTTADKKDKFSVLIYEVQRHPVTNKPIHIDFYQPSLSEEMEVKVPLVFEGEAPAVKDLNGTLVKNLQEIEVKAFPQNLPHEIRVNIEVLKTFKDNILVKDLVAPEGAKFLREPADIVALVVPAQKVEEELEKPIEEKVEEVEKVEKPVKEEREEKEGEGEEKSK